MAEKIRWLEWGKEAFERAKKENKPILMDIFGTWCHWCHRIEQDTYEKPEVIEDVNKNFVAIRVDTDQRPDINERYNQGGWPSTVFLDHDGEIITGATYIPPQQMLSLLDQVKLVFKKRGKIIPPKPLAKKRGVVTEEILLSMEEVVKRSFDPVYGGFGEPKFPMTEVLEFLLARFEKTKQKELLDMVEKSLQGMIAGIFDTVEGGFFRYSVTQDWKLPHYEKMLETNSGLVRVLSYFYKITKKEKYLEALKKTISYMLNTLSDKNGGFYSSQDADGEEKYYGKGMEERRKLPTPSIDKNMYADLNGLAIRSFLAYFEISTDKKIKEFIEKTIDFILKGPYSKEKGIAHYFEGKPQFLGLLRDNLNIALALLEAYRVFNKKEYLEKTQEIAGFILKNFHDKKEGGFFDKLEGGMGKLAMRNKIIGENAKVAILLFELEEILNKKEYQKIAEGALEIFAVDFKVYGLLAGEYALAAQKILE